MNIILSTCRIKGIFLLFALVAMSVAGSAQGVDIPEIKPEKVNEEADPLYIRMFPNTFTLRTYLGEKFSLFTLEDRKIGQKLEYRPNTVLTFGIGTTVKGIGINFSTKLPFHDTKEEKFGKTKRYDIQVHRYRGKLAADVYLQRYKGYHLATNDGIDSIGGTTAVPYFPEMRTILLGGTFMHVFNGNRFSMRAAVNQQEWQMKSAGSFMLGGGVFAQLIHNDSANIIPPYYKYPNFFDTDGLKQINSYSLTINGGYGYNHVFPGGHYFIGASGDVGAGPSYSRILDMDGDQQARVGLNVSANFRLAAGYNSDKWFAGIYGIAHGDQYSLAVRESSVTNAQGIVRFVVARRFLTKKGRVMAEGK